MAKHIIGVLCSLLILLASTTAFGQKSEPKYDTASEVTIKGEVQEVKTHENNVHLIVKAGDQISEVCLCPAEFLKSMDYDFAKGDKVEITGAKAKMDGNDVILARQIVKGDNTLVIRDKGGAPVWTWLMKKS